MNDVFVAYHGTDNPQGSAQKAKDLTIFLRSNGINAFCHLLSDNDNFAIVTKDEAYKSEMFIYVANKFCPRTSDGVLSSNDTNDEIDYFYLGHDHCYGNICGKIKVYAFGGLDSKEAGRLHKFFAGEKNICEMSGEEGQALGFEEVLKWVFLICQKAVELDSLKSRTHRILRMRIF